ncbi:uncharacterized protein BT62DRAFT_936081 [Guyanagaster necrorhizus]|uniref:Uncharacterized protein n=1 Tax=Guyanagaster necrorhizus TaxID=856835 RepID=A0A9P7VK02_9AGAR|nr:uncharacterized protein BT62DRAFT_936081 [Guyanagaster necrorhizus MCA 3950]KAG7442528.1 hypothetical protein BT62DRAFT_936081 [Guyanagaster necrorhizus MCA 3950]
MAQRVHPFSWEDMGRVQAERTSGSHQNKSQLEIHLLALHHYLYFSINELPR